MGSPARPWLNHLQKQPSLGMWFNTLCNLGCRYATSLIFLSGSILFSAAALIQHCLGELGLILSSESLLFKTVLNTV